MVHPTGPVITERDRVNAAFAASDSPLPINLLKTALYTALATITAIL